MQNFFRLFSSSHPPSDTSYSYSFSKTTAESSGAGTHAYVSYFLTQLAPLLVLLGLPALALLACNYTRVDNRDWNWDFGRVVARLVRIVFMVLESLFGLTLPISWNWGGGSGARGAGKGRDSEGRGEEKRRRRERGRERRKRSVSKTGQQVNVMMNGTETDAMYVHSVERWDGGGGRRGGR